MQLRLAHANWVGIEYSFFDAVQGLLVEHPESYYMGESRTWLCYLTRHKGLIMFTHDFTKMSDAEIDEYIAEELDSIG